MSIIYQNESRTPIYPNVELTKVYHQTTVVWESSHYHIDEVIFEQATAGTYSLDILDTGKYEVYCIAGGGSGAQRIKNRFYYYGAGGSGSGFIGIIEVTKGIFNIVVGAGASGNYEGYGYTGGNSSFGSLVTTYGGGGCNIHDGVAGGGGGASPTISTTIISTTLNQAGNNGTASSGRDTSTPGASVYNGYGAGGKYNTSSTNGYVKIVYKGS